MTPLDRPNNGSAIRARRAHPPLPGQAKLFDVRAAARVTGPLKAAGFGDGYELLARAEALAARILRTNAVPVSIDGLPGDRQVLKAGKGHFDALWARDASFAAMGALERGQYQVVHDSLDALLSKQREDGLVPRRIGRGSNAWAMIMAPIQALLELKAPEGSHFDTVEFKSGLGRATVDANALVIWLAAEYVAKSGDRAFLERHHGHLERALNWLNARSHNGLLVQGPYEDWKDLTKRSGPVLYTNVLYCQATKSLGDLAQTRGDAASAARHWAAAAALKQRINETFWDEAAGSYRDMPELELFSGDGNFLAIYTGLADRPRALSILDRADATLRTSWGWYAGVDRPYPTRLVPLHLSLFGMKGSGDDTMTMSLMTSFYAMAAIKVGETGRARRALEAVAKISLQDGTFEEVHEQLEPTPVKRRFYRSEQDFSWSAGLYLRALAELRRAGS